MIRNMLRYIIITLGIFVAAGMGLFFFLLQNPLTPKDAAEYFTTKGLQFTGVRGFSISESKETRAQNIEVTKIIAQKDADFLHIELTEKLGGELGQFYQSEKKSSIESLFLPYSAEYPGTLTQEVECPDEFHPAQGEVGDMHYYIMYANDRFAYGICAYDLVRYKFVLGLAYCDKSDIFVEIKLFSPQEIFSEENALELLRSFSCN